MNKNTNETENGECEVTGNEQIRKEQPVWPDTTKISGIYGIRCRTTDKWYIGQSWDIINRWRKQYKKLRCLAQPKIYNAIKKYGYDSFEERIIEVCDKNLPQVSMDEKETIWIAHYNSFFNGYNCTEKGGSNGPKSEETKKKIREKRKLQVISTEQREKQSKSLLGKYTGEKNPMYGKHFTMSDSHKEKIRNALKGKKKSLEHINKMKCSKKGKNTGKDNPNYRHGNRCISCQNFLEVSQSP